MALVQPIVVSLSDLPKECLSLIIECIIAEGGNPGDVFKLAVVIIKRSMFIVRVD